MQQGWILTVTPFLRVKMPTAEKVFFPRTVQSADLNSGKAKKFKNLTDGFSRMKQMKWQRYNFGQIEGIKVIQRTKKHLSITTKNNGIQVAKYVIPDFPSQQHNNKRAKKEEKMRPVENKNQDVIDN